MADKAGKSGRAGAADRIDASAHGADRPVARVLPALPALFALFLLLAAPLSAQDLAHTAGRVVRVAGGDTLPVPGVRVILHRVGRVEQGPVDSVVTGRRGDFDFQFVPDTTAIYLLSARYRDIEYFSLPVPTNPARPDTSAVIVVADTSSSAPVAIEARHLVIRRPASDGTRAVLDIIALQNPGSHTRVAPDSLSPSWRTLLPSTAIGLEVGPGDISPEAVARQGDTLLVYAPIAPGPRQVIVEYIVPADVGVFEVPFSDSVGMVNLLLEEADARVSGAPLAMADTQFIEGRAFQRWTGAVPAGSVARVDLPRPGQVARRALMALVAAMAVLLGVAAWRLGARRPRASGTGTPSRAMPSQLLDRVAALDARYQGREAEIEPSEWERYQTERARLRAELEAALASRSGVP